MKTTIIALVIAGIVGISFGLDCSAKIQAFKKCLADSHKQNEASEKSKFESLKSQLDACYTNNGCPAPSRPQKGGASGESTGKHGNFTQGIACRKAIGDALKQQMQSCIQQAVPGVVFPQNANHDEDGEHERGFGGFHRGGFDHKEGGKFLANCTNKQKVLDCQRALFNASRPTEDQRKAAFQARCNAKQTCLASLGADCQAQMEQVRKAACQCRQQQEPKIESIKSGIPACANLPERHPKQGGSTPHPRPQINCDAAPQDYCKLGYDAFVQAHQKHGPKGGKGSH